jgi:hypothetical protein
MCGWPRPGAETNKNNKMSWTTSECIAMEERVYRVGDSHSYILDIFCHTEDSKALTSNQVSSD